MGHPGLFGGHLGPFWGHFPPFFPPAPDECFEALRIDAFSSPPELPDVMKPQDSAGGANETPVQ